MPDGPSPRHSVSVAAAIFDDAHERVLLIKRRDNGNWEIPGGVLKLEETIEDGLRREVREETGAEIEIGPLTGLYKNISQGVVALVFRCRLATQPLSSTDEAQVVQWGPVACIGTEMRDTHAIRVRDALATQTPASRAHDGTRVL